MGHRYLNDARLTVLAAAGDAAAVEAIYNRHSPDLYRFLLSLLREPEDAKDVLQTTMLKAISALSSVRPMRIRPWLFGIARNEAIDMLRRRRPQQQLDELMLPTRPGVDEEVADRNRITELLEDLRDLPDRQRSALVLRELCELDYDEIGYALGMAAATARQAVYEARRGLQERAQGRSASCDTVQLALSNRDGRVGRAVRVRAHLLDCACCREFKAALASRPDALRVLFPPMPVALAASVRQALLTAVGGGSAGGGLGLGAAGVAGALGGKALLAALSIGVGVGVGVGIKALDRDPEPPTLLAMVGEGPPLATRPPAKLAPSPDAAAPIERRSGSRQSVSTDRRARTVDRPGSTPVARPQTGPSQAAPGAATDRPRPSREHGDEGGSSGAQRPTTPGSGGGSGGPVSDIVGAARLPVQTEVPQPQEAHGETSGTHGHRPAYGIGAGGGVVEDALPTAPATPQVESIDVPDTTDSLPTVPTPSVPGLPTAPAAPSINAGIPLP